jgi:hypothetical protein
MSRAVFILVTAFWLTMNVLLWQTEFGSRQSGGAVPVKTVWEKILTAADDSSLTVYDNGKLVGACHLRTAVGEQWSTIGDENVPSGPPDKNRSFRLRLDGSAVLPELTNRIRFDGDLKLDKNREWEELNARVAMRPATWEIHSIAAEQKLHLKVEGGDIPFDVVLQFSDLQNPGGLAYQLLGPAASELMNEAGLQSAPHGSPAPGLGVKWEAYEDTIHIGHTAVQVYQLRTRLLDRYDISVLVSRAGEILRVNLPNGILLLNDRLAAAAQPRVQKSESKAP